MKRALRRAELKNKTKSLEDITSFGSSTCKENVFIYIDLDNLAFLVHPIQLYNCILQGKNEDQIQVI